MSGVCPCKSPLTSMCKFGPNMCSTTLLLISQSASSFAIDLREETKVSIDVQLDWTTNTSGLVTLTSQCQTPGTRYYRRRWRCAVDSTETQAQINEHRLDTTEKELVCFCASRTVIWLSPASLMVSVGLMKYLKARSKLSLSKHSALSSGSFTVLHIRSAMLRAALWRNSWSDNLHRYLQRERERDSHPTRCFGWDSIWVRHIKTTNH